MSGWIKVGDVKTAYGNTVLPIPFLGMESYPPSVTNLYSQSPELQNYLKEYNIRIDNNG